MEGGRCPWSSSHGGDRKPIFDESQAIDDEINRVGETIWGCDSTLGSTLDQAIGLPNSESVSVEAVDV